MTKKNLEVIKDCSTILFLFNSCRKREKNKGKGEKKRGKKGEKKKRASPLSTITSKREEVRGGGRRGGQVTDG